MNKITRVVHISFSESNANFTLWLPINNSLSAPSPYSLFENPLVDDEQCRPRGISAFFILDQCHGPRNTYVSSTKTVGNKFWIKEDISVEPSSIDSLGLFVLDSMKAIAVNNFLFLFANKL